jgi:hypothetical protein
MKNSSQNLTILFLFVLITASATAQNISPNLFGQNMWLTDGAEGRAGYLDKIWPKVQSSGVKLIRIGGNGYNKKMPDLETLTNWVNAIKSIGAEPLLQVSKFKSAAESAKLVAHFNEDEKTKIKYWSIGNEPYKMDHIPLDSIAIYIKEHASAMKAVDPSIKIIVPDLAAYYNEAYEALLLNDKNSVAGRDKNGNWYIDGINFHNYPNAKEYSRSDVIFYSVTKMRGMILDLVEDVKAANLKYERNGDDALIWGITEFNITYNNPDDLSASGVAVPSFINGQFWVDVFAMAMEYNAFTVTPWCLQESDRASSYFGYIGGPPDFIPNSSYYHYKMMADNMKGQYIKMQSNNPFVKVFGSQSDDFTTILIMNQNETKSFALDLGAINKTNTKTEYLKITAVQDLKANQIITVKPNSTLLLKFDKKGKKIKELLYDLEMAINNKSPMEMN